MPQKYDPRVLGRALDDPKSHNFPHTFDRYILEIKLIKKPFGYRIYRKEGYMNGKKGEFEIGKLPDGAIDHRFFRPFP
jgi:hypothetical protein